MSESTSSQDQDGEEAPGGVNAAGQHAAGASGGAAPGHAPTVDTSQGDDRSEGGGTDADRSGE